MGTSRKALCVVFFFIRVSFGHRLVYYPTYSIIDWVDPSSADMDPRLGYLGLFIVLVVPLFSFALAFCSISLRPRFYWERLAAGRVAVFGAKCWAGFLRHVLGLVHVSGWAKSWVRMEFRL
jgi:hypothetical protein